MAEMILGLLSIGLGVSAGAFALLVLYSAILKEAATGQSDPKPAAWIGLIGAGLIIFGVYIL